MNQLKAVNLKFVVFILASHFLLFACTTGDQVVFDSKERAATVPEEIEVEGDEVENGETEEYDDSDIQLDEDGQITLF
jgi:hypothetical protein